MKPLFRNTLILIAPFLLMILVNEAVRPLINSKPYTCKNIPCINSEEIDKNFCSWACLNTEYCNANHSKILKHKELDPVYLGVVSALGLNRSDNPQGNGGLSDVYVLMNIIFLVVLIPLSIWFFTIKSLNIQDKINKFKKDQKL